jgi:hypothetical protein
MNRSHWASVIVVLLTVPFTRTICAQDPPPLREGKSAHGLITVVQKETRQFVLKTDTKELIFTVDAGAKLRAAGKDITWNELEDGIAATVTFKLADGKYQVLTVEGGRKEVSAKPADGKQPEKKDEAVPISVKGRILKVDSDLKEMSLTTFDDKEIQFVIDEALQYRLRNSKTGVPNLNAGTEVSAVYILDNGKNMLVVLRDAVPTKEPPPGVKTEERTQGTTISKEKTVTYINQPGPGARVLLPGVATPGFISSANRNLGSVVGRIVTIRNDLVVLAAGGMAPINPQPPGDPGQPGVPPGGLPPARPPAGPPPGAQPPADPRTPVREGEQRRPPGQPPANPGPPAQGGGNVAAEYFVLLGLNSKEPFQIDQQTRVLLNGSPGRLADLGVGMEIQATFDVAGDGTRRVLSISAQGNAPRNPVPGQPGGAAPPVQNPAGPAGGAANTRNALVGRIVRIKGDLLVLVDGKGEFFVIAAFNSREPFIMDQGTGISINNQEARFADLRVGADAQVFFEIVNDARRVFGIVATAGAANQPVPERGAGDPNRRPPDKP